MVMATFPEGISIKERFLGMVKGKGTRISYHPLQRGLCCTKESKDSLFDVNLTRFPTKSGGSEMKR